MKTLSGILFVVYVIFLFRSAFTGFSIADVVSSITSPLSIFLILALAFTSWRAGKKTA